MQTTLRYAAPILLGLALFTGASYFLVSATSRSWFEDDVRMRAELALRGAHGAIAEAWGRADRHALIALLNDITSDERILAAAACAPDGTAFAQTPDFPPDISCRRFVRHSITEGHLHIWNRIDHTKDGGSVYLSALPIISASGVSLGVVGLIHDMSFVEARDALTRRAALWLFGFLAVGALLLSSGITRASWRRFRAEVRGLLKGERERPEFKPLLQDIRELAGQLASDARAAEGASVWTPDRLREVLRGHLQGEKVIMVANREPYIHDRGPSGEVRVLHPASGLVTALEPVMRACSGVWVAHGSGSADREASDRKGRLLVPPGEDSYTLRRIWLTAEEEQGYYYRFANEGLWPLCHIAHARPAFREEDFEHYRTVNQRFADAVCDEADGEDPIVLVQDYHFALAPKMIRERLPRATILTFWHIPWPNAELFGICPFREKLLEGLLGSSIVGFHVQAHCNNFIESVDRYLETRVDRERTAIVHTGDTTLVRPYPISIEWPNQWAAKTPPAPDCRASVLAELGLAPDALIGVGVDRLDYTKGIEERILAVEQLLVRYPQFRGRFTFVQLAAPSRTAIDRYRELNRSVEQLAARVNAQFGAGKYRPIILQRQHHEPPRVFQYLRAADVCYVSSLHDGMNLVAKEFIAARDDERGVLVLSQFTGAARELSEALIVNPYDLRESSAALATALTMTPHEQQERLRALRAIVSEFNVYRWAGRMLTDAARLRQRDRLTQRLEAKLTGIEGVA